MSDTLPPLPTLAADAAPALPPLKRIHGEQDMAAWLSSTVRRRSQHR